MMDIQPSSIQKFQRRKPLTRPIYITSIAAGFPSPADDYTDLALDLNEHLIHHPSATFFARARGDSMERAGIYDGDLLVIDRAIDPGNDSIVVAVINGEFTIKQIGVMGKKLYLIPRNPKFEPTEITDDMDFQIWGVVTYTIHQPQ